MSGNDERHREGRGTTPHHHPLLVEGRPQPTCLRSVARRLGSAPTCAQATLTAMPAAPAVYAFAARVSQLRQRVAPGSVQPASPSVLRGGRTRWLRCLPLAPLRIHSLRSGHGLMQGERAQVGSAPHGGAQRSGGRWAAAWSWLVHGWWWGVGSSRDSAGRAPGRATEPTDYHGRPRAPCDPRRAPGSRQPRSRLRRPRGLTDLSRPAPPSPGSRGALTGSHPPPVPAPKIPLQGSGRSRPHARARGRRGGIAPRLGEASSCAGAAVGCSVRRFPRPGTPP